MSASVVVSSRSRSWFAIDMSEVPPRADSIAVGVPGSDGVGDTVWVLVVPPVKPAPEGVGGVETTLVGDEELPLVDEGEIGAGSAGGLPLLDDVRGSACAALAALTTRRFEVSMGA